MSDPNQLSIDLIFSNEQWRQIDDLEPLVEKAARAACKAASTPLVDTSQKKGPFEVAINLSDDASITKLNHDFRGNNKPTNVLSFPFENDFPEQIPGAAPLGDIILAFETIEAEASDQQIEPGHHIAHLVVHGMLHLFGYDHLVTSEAEEMEGLETDILATLNIPSPYRDS